MSENKITVILATRDRSSETLDCLKSLQKSTLQEFSVLVIDQSQDNNTKNVITSLKDKRITYFKTEFVGTSRAKNLGILKATTPLIAFTDSDCIVHPSWLKEIINFYKTHPKVKGIIGNSYPYQPEKHIDQFCPAIFKASKISLYTSDQIASIMSLGHGNNMSFYKSALQNVGLYKEWLGGGSIGKAAEDRELLFRFLNHGYTLAINPKMVIYHNNWMNRGKYNLLQHQYTTGLLAFFVYYFFLDKEKKQIWKFIQLHWQKRTTPRFRQVFHLIKETIKETVFLLLEISGVIKGSLIGLTLALKEKLFDSQK